MPTPTPGRAIVISNGRCGSTLLSDLIHSEPETLSVQEFFMSVAPWSASGDVVDGAAYWRVLSSPKPEVATLFRIGLPPKELHYPAGGRWAGDMVELPRILAITLSKISDDPDALFDVLAERVPAFPVQSIAAHHRMFLDLLTELTGKRRWVERSGGSSNVTPYLLRGFPEARIVYLTRDREAIAKSMSRHPSFQLIQLRVEFIGRCGVDPFRMEPGATVPDDLAPYLPDRLTAARLRERGNDVRRYLGLCAFLTSQAEQALEDSPPEHLLRMRYEELVADPVGELERLGAFLQFDDPRSWARQVAGRVVAPAPKTVPVAA
ncbi:hypothetical protein [Dactylosporangium sp. CA-092794]|uniref:hypothetical protein n=1 Tax=Dactylosporangium sp. CA-092794 TaxID=3239929 RepID=UPI003D8E50BE